MPIITGETDEIRDAVFAEATYHAAYEPQRAIRTPRWKYVRRFEPRHGPVLPNTDDSPSKDLWLRDGWPENLYATEQLYDLELDPNEAWNRIDDPRLHETANELRVRLERWMAGTGDPLLDGPIPPPPGALVNDADGVSALEPPQVIAYGRATGVDGTWRTSVCETAAMHTSLAIGFGLGFFVAAQLGPISLLLIRSVMRGAVITGLAIGAGAAVVDTGYACLGVLGAAPLISIGAIQLALGLVGAVVLVALGIRTLWSAFRVRLGGETADEVATPRRAFMTSLAATASNPFTIASWAAIFAAASTAQAAATPGGTAALVAGIGIGSISWFTILACGVGLARRHVGERFLRAVDVVAGAGLLVFGVLLGARAVAEE